MALLVRVSISHNEILHVLNEKDISLTSTLTKFNRRLDLRKVGLMKQIFQEKLSNVLKCLHRLQFHEIFRGKLSKNYIF